MLGQALEAAMLICFGLSWPLNAYKSYQARTAAGTSWQFLLLIALGYVAGIAAKFVSGQINWVLIVYFLNLVFLAANWTIYVRNTKLDRANLAAAGTGDAAPAAEAPAFPAPSRILLATDGSAASLAAARFALSALHTDAAQALVATAVESDTPQANKVACERIEPAADLLRSAGVPCTTQVLHGPAATQIVDAARAHDADLVVMGSRGLSGLKSAALGSVSRTVAEYSEKPVLIVK